MNVIYGVHEQRTKAIDFDRMEETRACNVYKIIDSRESRTDRDACNTGYDDSPPENTWD